MRTLKLFHTYITPLRSEKVDGVNLISATPPQRNTLVFRRFLLVPVVSYWCPSFLIRARRFLLVHEHFMKDEKVLMHQ